MVWRVDRRTIELLREAGVELSLDWDDTLQVEIEADVQESLLAMIKRHHDEFVGGLKQIRKRELEVFVGGSLNGQRIPGHMSHWYGFLHHVCRARWEVYVHGADGRAFYAGERTSRPKAKALAIEKWKSTAVKRLGDS